MNKSDTKVEDNALPPGWVLVRLEELVENPRQDVVDGPFGSNLKASEYVASGIPIARLQNIDRGSFNPKKLQYVTREKAVELSRHSFQSGDILITKLGDPLGEACIVPTSIPKGIIVADLVRVRPNGKAVNTKYLELAVNSPNAIRELKQHTKGTTRPRVNLSILRELTVPLAPLVEQQKLVSKIDQLYSDLDASVAALERARANLKRYRASVLKAAVEGRLTAEWRKTHPATEPASQLLERILAERRKKWEDAQLAKFAAAGKATPKNWKDKYPEPAKPDTANLPELPEGWCWASVDQCSSFESYAITDGPFGSNLKSEHYTESGPRVIRLQNIGDGYFVDEYAHISDEHFASLKKHSVENGDLVIAVLGEELPRACVIPDGVAPAIVKADCVRFKPKAGLVDSDYMNYVLNSYPTRFRCSKQIKGVGRPRLNLSHIRGIAVPLPPIGEQSEIVLMVSELSAAQDRMDQQLVKSISQAAHLRQSILKRAFEGKLVPQDPNDEPASVLLERIRAARAGAPKAVARRGRKPKAPA